MARTSNAKDSPEGLDGAVGKKALRYVEIEFLKVDPSYQRGIVPKHRSIAAKFDSDAFGVPLVGQREDGSLWVVDGQQRIKALEILGKKKCRCDVFASRGPEHEAHVFKLVNKNRTALNSVELFRAALAEGDEDAHELNRILTAEGFKVGKARLPQNRNSEETIKNTISCINTLTEIYRRKKGAGGEAGVRFVLATLKAAWPDDPVRVKIEVVGGLGKWFSDMGGNADPDRLIPRLRTITPSKLVYAATMGIGDRFSNVAEAVAKVYRKRVGKQS